MVSKMKNSNDSPNSLLNTDHQDVQQVHILTFGYCKAKFVNHYVMHYENQFQLVLLFEEVKKPSKQPCSNLHGISVDGKRSEITTGRYCEPNNGLLPPVG